MDYGESWPPADLPDISVRRVISDRADDILEIITERDQKTEIRMEGAFSVYTAGSVKDEIYQYAEDENVNSIVVDLSKLAFFDSTALGVLFFGMKRAERNSKEYIIRLRSKKDSIYKIFELTGCNSIFKFSFEEE